MASQFEINRKALEDYFATREIQVRKENEDSDSVLYSDEFDVQGRMGHIHMFIFANDTEIQSIGVSHVNATEDVRQAVAEYITRANYGLRIGKFEMSFEDGEIRFHAILSCMNNAGPGFEDVRLIVEAPPEMFSAYGDGLLEVIFGITDPASAIAAAEEV